MIFVKLNILNFLKRPIDNNYILKDGERLLGANKTWKGFLGMVFLTAFFMWLIVFLVRHNIINQSYLLYNYKTFGFLFAELFYGAFWGTGYVLFELPNSFIKRRLQIPAGENVAGFKGLFFKFLDQADSVVGCIIFMFLFYRPDWRTIFLIFILGAIVHYIINLFLFLVRLKKQAG